MKNPFAGCWRITWMKEWDEEYLDLVVPAYINFGPRHQGEFQFGTVTGFTDYRVAAHPDSPRVDWSWEGQSENDPACGRGWAELKGSELRGVLFIHCSDESPFIAVPYPERGRGPKARR